MSHLRTTERDAVRDMVQALVDGLGIDEASRQAGYQAGRSGAVRECPESCDKLSWLCGHMDGQTARECAQRISAKICGND